MPTQALAGVGAVSVAMVATTQYLLVPCLMAQRSADVRGCLELYPGRWGWHIVSSVRCALLQAKEATDLYLPSLAAGLRLTPRHQGIQLDSAASATSDALHNKMTMLTRTGAVAPSMLTCLRCVWRRRNRRVLLPNWFLTAQLRAIAQPVHFASGAKHGQKLGELGSARRDASTYPPQIQVSSVSNRGIPLSSGRRLGGSP